MTTSRGVISPSINLSLTNNGFKGVIFKRIWAMPNKNTFSIKPIRQMIDRYHNKSMFSIDPFANSNKIARVLNDLDPQYQTESNQDAVRFLRDFNDNSIDFVFYDPPYSSRQVSESYRKMGFAVNMETTQGSYWKKLKDQIARIVKPEGLVLSCGWNSGGIGKTNGFELIEVLLVPHGGIHNDTIIILEKKSVSVCG